MDETTRRALQLISSSSRDLADALDQLLSDQTTTSESVSGGTSPREPGAVWDPEVDPPRIEPKVTGSREEVDWCSLTYLAGIYAINKRYGRGATRDEIRDYAVKAGYRDGRAVTAWSKGNGATQNDAEKQRWVTQNGVDWIKGLAAKLDVSWPDDLAESWQAPEF